MLTNIMNQQILHIVIIIRKTFNNVKVVHAILDLQIHILHKAGVV